MNTEQIKHNGLGIATTAIISRTLGAGAPDQARRQGRLILLTGICLLALLVISLWLDALLGGIHGLFMGALVGNLLAGLMAWQVFQKGLSQLRQQNTGAPLQQ